MSMPAEPLRTSCVRCRDWGKYERHEDHWPPVETLDNPEEDQTP